MSESVALRWSDYIPHTPQPKQAAFLMLPHKEAFYGGAAGGGKSDALLMAALQYVDVPGYAAILFRKTLSELKLPQSLLDRAHTWLAGKDCLYVASEHTYYFPTKEPDGTPGDPSKVVFGYIGNGSARERYQSAEFQFCGFDELTHHTLNDYTWMFSRLRKKVCPKHPNLDPVTKEPVYNDNCPWCQVRKNLPERMRSASNPGSTGHKWVQNRFRIEPTQVNGEVFYLGQDPERPYIPATLDDNAYVDQKSYGESLEQLDPITRAQLRRGDWGASLDSRYKASWFAQRRYHRRNEYYVLGPSAKGILLSDFQRIFTVIDPAASAREGPGDENRYKKMDKSYTVIMTFGLTDDYNLVLLDNVRLYVEAPDILKFAKAVYKRWHPVYLICEASGVGKAVYQALNKAGLPVKPTYPHTDKLNRATDALIRAEKGQIWLPEHPGPPWLKILEDELFTWTAHPYETDDQIDCISMAANDVSWEAAPMEAQDDPEIGNLIGEDGPSIISNPFGESPAMGTGEPWADYNFI